MDIILVVLGLLCCIIGLLGSFLPALPGPPISWVGLLLLYLTSFVENNYWVLGITLVLTIIISVLDYVIPSKGTKKFGGTKYGVWGTNIGLIIGLFFPPIGFIIGFAWFSIVLTSNPKMLFFAVDGGKPICSRPSKQTFKCKVYKNGEVIHTT